MNDLMVVVENNLKNELESKAMALPDNFNKMRFVQNCLTVLKETKNIEKIDPISIVTALLKGAFLNLDFFHGECYAIPYSGVMNFQTDYKGEKKLCEKYSERKIKDIYAKLVRVGDEFIETVKEGRQVVNFNPKSFSDEKIIGCFAIVYYEDGGMSYETMSTQEIEEIKKRYSKKDKEGNYSPAWRYSIGEMYKKTVMRRLCKTIPLNFDNKEQVEAYREGAEHTFKKDILDIRPAVENVFEQKKEIIIEKTEQVSNEVVIDKESNEDIDPSKQHDGCEECGIEVSEKVKAFSLKKFNKILCYNCQNKK
jgi:recombination protein RecT